MFQGPLSTFVVTVTVIRREKMSEYALVQHFNITVQTIYNNKKTTSIGRYIKEIIDIVLNPITIDVQLINVN